MLTSQTGVVLHDKSDWSPEKSSSKQPLPDDKWTRSRKSLKHGGYQAMPQTYLSQLCSMAVISMGPHRNVCLCVYFLKRMNAVKPLPLWNGGPIMTVSFSMQPCKTKLHEIDYPHTWTSFVTQAFLLSPATSSLPGPDHFLPTENKCFKDAWI